MKPGPEILERNLEALLRRAYVPAVPRESFRRDLLEDFADRAASRAGLTVRPSGPSAQGSADPARAGQPPHARRALLLRTALAAAAVLLVFFTIGQLRETPGGAGGEPDVLLAEGSLAVRHAPEGAWERAAAELALEGAFLEVATPASRSAFVELAAGTAELEPQTRAAFHAGLERAGIDLEHGGLRVTAETELELSTPGGALTLLSGSLRVAPGVPAPLPEGWTAASGRAWWSVQCLAGRVSLPAPGGGLGGGPEEPVLLSAGERAFLRGGRTWLPPTVGAVAATGETRREVVVTAEEQAHEAAALRPETSAPAPAQQPPVLFGRVLGPAPSDPDAEGLPMARFEVVVLQEVALPQVAQPQLFEFEDPQGAFELADLAPGSYRLFVRAEGHALWRSEKLAIRAEAEPLELQVELELGRTVRGIVIDGLTGNPIAGAVVLSETDAPLQILAIDTAEHPSELLVRAITGADGGFELEHLSSEAQVLRASAAGYGPDWTPRLEAESSGLLPAVEFVLEEGGAIAGVVEDDAGLGVAGAQLITSLTDFTSAHPVLTYVRATSDEQGRFEMRDLPEGSWAVLKFGVMRDPSEASSPDLAFVQVFAGETAEVNFRQTVAALRLHGVVTDPTGAPVVGRAIWLTDGVGVGPEAMQSMTTDAAGGYEFSVQPDRYSLSISGVSPAEMYVLARPDMTAGVDLELDLQLAAGSIAGRVQHGETGRPLGELVLVCARAGGSGLDLDFMGKTTSAADGSFVFANLAPGRYEVVAFSAEGLGEERSGVLEVGEEPVEGVGLELWPGGALVLTVVGPDGPVPNALVRFERRGGGWMRFGELQRTTAQGRYVVPGMRAASWTVVIEAEGFETLIETLRIPLGDTLRTRLELRAE